jgi:uncharacterized membrane protein
VLCIPVSFLVGWNLAGFISQHSDIAPVLREAVALATTKKPETFTELYFGDHIDLPKKIEIGKKQSFSFTIHNLEYKDMTYKYEISAFDDEADRSIYSDSVNLSHDEYKTIGGSYTVATASGRIKIEVLLVNKNQSIHFWLE